MSSSSDKSKRKILSIKRDQGPEAQADVASGTGKKRAPLRGRHLPMRQQRAAKPGAEPAAREEGPKHKPAAHGRGEPERQRGPAQRDASARRDDRGGREDRRGRDDRGGRDESDRRHGRPRPEGERRGEQPGERRPSEGRGRPEVNRHPEGHKHPDGYKPQEDRREGRRFDERGPRGERPSYEGREAQRRRPRPDAEPQREARERPRRAAPAAEARVQHYFAPCPRGLEQELAKELAELGAADPVPGSGGVAFTGDIGLAWKVNLWSRLAIRVLQRVAEGGYRSEDDLYVAARELPWTRWFEVDRSIAVRTVAHRSPLKSLNFASLKIKDALCDAFRDAVGGRPNVDPHHPDVPVLLFLNEDRYTLYLDLTGEPLNRRGYRVEAAEAPINECLAAGMLRLAGWTPDTPLLDPMMGGGTILLEAALMALNVAPGLRRRFAFERLASFDKVEWARLRKTAQAEVKDRHPLPIYGCDTDPAMVEATEANLREAGVLECVTLREADALEVKAPAPFGVIVSNPPYGVRLTHEDMAAFYKGLGDNLKRNFSGWRAYLISADTELPHDIGLKASRRTPLYNGPLECRLYEYKLVSGQMRREKPRG